MLVYLTKDISIEVEKKFDAVSPYHALLKEFFSDRFYGDDLTTLYISALCWSPKFEHFFKLRRPNLDFYVRAAGVTCGFSLQYVFNLPVSDKGIKKLKDQLLVE